jgi:hypothetical protein
MACEPSLSPPELDEDEGLLSNQALGETTAMVEYEVGLFGLPTVAGAWIEGKFVEAEEFSQRRLTAWTVAISREIDKGREIESWD